ncbi:hypothetical protein VTH06DRAFT_7809 [Thermothelomyces fergusii]
MRPSPRQVPDVFRAAAIRSRPPRPRLFPPRALSTSTSSSSNPAPPSAASSPSVNETEISHFSALAASWWDPHGPSRPLHLMNPLRHEFIRACLASSSSAASPSPSSPSSPSSQTPPPGGGGGLRYLDVGCGGGIFAESAARLADTASVTGVDPSAAVVAVARAHARRDPALALASGAGKLRYVHATIEALALPADARARFDVVSVFEVVEHVERPGAFLDRAGDFVRPGGWLVLSTIARTWTSWLTTKVVAEDVLRLVPRGTHDWRKYVNEHELRAYFAAGARGRWGPPRVMGVVYVPGLGWKAVRGSEKLGNYFFGVQKIG